MIEVNNIVDLDMQMKNKTQKIKINISDFILKINELNRKNNTNYVRSSKEDYYIESLYDNSNDSVWGDNCLNDVKNNIYIIELK